MNTRAIASEYRLHHWASIMQERKESGLSIKAFCKNAGFHENRYYYWQKRLRKAACEELAQIHGSTTSLLPAKPKSEPSVIWAGIDTKALDTAITPTRSSLTVSRDGWTVTVEPGVDTGLLTEVIRAVNQSCC